MWEFSIKRGQVRVIFTGIDLFSIFSRDDNRKGRDEFRYLILILIEKIHQHYQNSTYIKLLSHPHLHRVTNIYLYSYSYLLSY